MSEPPSLEELSASQAVTQASTRAQDTELLRGCRAGDESAWQALVERYERLVYSIPLNYGLSAADAADIAQLTFTYLIQALDQLQADSNLGGWLATVARRQTWRLVTRRRRESVHAAPEEAEATGATVLWSSGTDWQARWEQLEWIESGMVHLQPRCRELLTLLYFDPEEPTYDEIATRMTIKVGSIGPTRARCLERLREFLQR